MGLLLGNDNELWFALQADGLALFWIAQSLLQAVGKLHVASVLHRHVRPASIYLIRSDSEAQVVKLGDLGLAKRLHRVRAPSLLVWGSDDRLVPPSYAKRWTDRV